ncbi:MAG: MBL fold metallo-hydrolase [bacterium]|nr:MBL fold metallo-hydrolase [bacterium]
MHQLKKHKFFILILVALFLLDGFLWIKIFTASDKFGSEIYFFDVGQGDSALVLTETGNRVLIDGGREGSGVLEELNKVLGKDRYIDLVVMTHGDFDHYGGFLDILDSYEVGAFVSSGRAEGKDSYHLVIDKLAQKDVKYISLAEGDSILFGREIFSILSPSSAEILSEDLNDTSLVMLFENDAFSVLFTGDAGAATEQRLAREYDLSADVLKVGHHGSKTSSDLGFLQELLPLASVISVGENSYGHPNEEVMANLLSVSQVFRTDEEGSIKVFSEEGNLLFEKLE